MPERETIERARKDAREGKSPSTQAGEFVREEIHHIREGRHGAQSAKQAIAIGLSKARDAGVDLPSPKRKATSKRTKSSTSRRATPQSGTSTRKRTTSRTSAPRAGATTRRKSTTRSRAVSKALQREGQSAASPRALSRQTRSAAKRRTASSRSAAAKKAARTKGAAGRSAAARKAAQTRARR
jgi:hypothetical protein